MSLSVLISPFHGMASGTATATAAGATSPSDKDVNYTLATSFLFHSEFTQFQNRPDAPPAIVSQQAAEITGANNQTIQLTYETIVINTETEAQYKTTINWFQEQIELAKSHQVTYQIYDLATNENSREVQDSLGSNEEINKVVIDEERVKSFVPEWAKQTARYLREKTLGAANALELAPRKAKDAITSKFMSYAKKMAGQPDKYRRNFAIARWGINGVSTSMAMMLASHDLGAALITGLAVMGPLSFTLQYWLHVFNDDYLLTHGRYTQWRERLALARAKNRVQGPLSQSESFEIAQRITSRSTDFKWALLEAGFLGAGHAAMLHMGHDLLPNENIATWIEKLGVVGEAEAHLFSAVGSFGMSLGASIFAQAAWETGNAENKRLDLMKAQHADEVRLALFLEKSRSLAASAFSVGSMALTMVPHTGFKMAGVALLIGFGLRGMQYRNNIRLKTMEWKCEQFLKGTQNTDKVS